MNEQCGTCKIINLDTDDVVVAKTKFWRVALQSNQAYLGQSFVTLLNHKGNLSELSAEEWSDFEALVMTLEKAIKETLGATHLNWSCLMNEAYRTADPLPHVHWHVFPRYAKSVNVNGVVFEDLEFGQHYINRSFKVDNITLEIIGSRLKERL